MAATTLTELAQEWLDRAAADRAAAETEVGLAQANLAAARLGHETALAAVADQEQVVDEIRNELAAATTTAEGEALLTQLQSATIEHRSRIGGALTAGRAVDDTETALENADAVLATAREDERRHTAELEEATAYHEQREAAKTAVTGTLADLPSEAGNALTPPNPTPAADRVAAAIPDALRDRARARAAAEATRADEAAAALGALLQAATGHLETTRPAAGAVVAAGTTFEAAAAALAAFASGGADDVARGVALLAAVAGAAAPDPDQAAGAADSAVADPGTAAASAEADRDAKAAEVVSAEDALELAILEAKLGDPDVVTATVSAIDDAETTLATKQGELAALEAAYTAVKADLDAWEAAVPDEEWRLLERFDTAERLLTSVAGIAPDDLASDATDTEAALVAALVAQDKEMRSQAIGDSTVRLARTRAASRGSSANRSFSRLRGDD